MTYIDNDQLSRDKIKNDISSNYFVEAGAGSGKTSVLVERMASMVEKGIDISKICAITFTKAAAGEFYARFQNRLTQSQSENAKRALQNIDLCFMGTIDAFCNMILSEHPAKAMIPSDSEIVDNNALEKLYLSEYSRIQNGDYTKELKEKSRRFKGLFYDHRDMFLAGVKIVSGNKNVHFNYIAPGEGTPDKILGKERMRLLEVLDYIKNHPEIGLDKQTKKDAESWNALLNDSSEIFESWNDNLGGVQSTLKKFRDIRLSAAFELEKLGPGFEHFFIPHFTRDKLTHYELNNGEDPLLVNRIQSLKFSIAMDFIVPAALAISEELRRRGKLTFNDYLIYLRDMLKKDAAEGGKLIEHIYNRHSYFLIDEFQDTNPIQAEVFFYLTARHPDEDWTRCVPKPGSLFIVGDPKQSIYRFRSADVASFMRVRGLFENSDVGEVLHLTRNFRSSDNMCRWFNDTFSGLLPEDTEFQSKFNDIPLGDKKPYTASLCGAYRYEAVMPRSLRDSDDPMKVADIIRRIVDNPEVTIQDRDENGSACQPRPASYKDFMLITPGKTHLGYYMNALSAAGIPFRVEGQVMFSQCPALFSLSCLMAAVADPMDKKAVFSSMALSGCDITREKIFEYSSRAKQMSPAGVFSMLLEEERVFAKAGAENAEYVYFALELLRSAEEAGEIASLKDGAEFISDLINEKSELERCVQLRPDANCVHIANLHKVKGLEAPIVILAEPRTTNKKPGVRIDSTPQPPEGWIFMLDNAETPDYAAEKAIEEAVLQSEKERLLYVAATRAANVLIISEGLNASGEPVSNNPWRKLLDNVDKNIFSVLPNRYQEHIPPEIKDADTLYTEAEDESVLNDRTSENKSYEIIRPSMISLKSKLSSDEEYDEKALETLSSSAKKNPALIGTLVHKLMESIVSSENTADLSFLIEDICDNYGITDPYYSEILKTVGERIQNGGYPQTGNLPQDILTELLSADEVHCELPFCYAGEENKIFNGVIDVVYRKNGKWHIIDYKTNTDDSDLDKQYEGQLSAYIEAFKATTGEDADAAVYHIVVN